MYTFFDSLGHCHRHKCNLVIVGRYEDDNTRCHLSLCVIGNGFEVCRTYTVKLCGEDIHTVQVLNPCHHILCTHCRQPVGKLFALTFQFLILGNKSLGSCIDFVRALYFHNSRCAVYQCLLFVNQTNNAFARYSLNSANACGNAALGRYLEQTELAR